MTSGTSSISHLRAAPISDTPCFLIENGGRRKAALFCPPSPPGQPPGPSDYERLRFNLPRRAVRRPSQSSHMLSAMTACLWHRSCARQAQDSRYVAKSKWNKGWLAHVLAPNPSHSRQVDHRNTAMIKVLERLLDKISREHAARKPTPIARPNRSNTAGDFRSVSVAPSIMCCAAATQAAGRPHLLRDAPRLPLAACTMPIHCSCKFRKNADRREGDRRLFGATETNRWFPGPDNRKRRSRRSTEK